MKLAIEIAGVWLAMFGGYRVGMLFGYIRAREIAKAGFKAMCEE